MSKACTFKRAMPGLCTGYLFPIRMRAFPHSLPAKILLTLQNPAGKSLLFIQLPFVFQKCLLNAYSVPKLFWVTSAAPFWVGEEMLSFMCSWTLMYKALIKYSCHRNLIFYWPGYIPWKTVSSLRAKVFISTCAHIKYIKGVNKYFLIVD
jgi:hypothetical protein